MCACSRGECSAEAGQHGGGPDGLENCWRASLGPDLHRGAGEGQWLFPGHRKKIAPGLLRVSLSDLKSTAAASVRAPVKGDGVCRLLEGLPLTVRFEVRKAGRVPGQSEAPSPAGAGATGPAAGRGTHTHTHTEHKKERDGHTQQLATSIKSVFRNAINTHKDIEMCAGTPACQKHLCRKSLL